ncbi:Por secretion system C-terminal sorting domain-containing protein [Catalinimonas alkaloidigena]|uniref:Por secretion system C-terminal sorting domain-containing protein n=1 Tax=Catalinimonas alkaloidigena TaxID=1075417 RepID=A0A1G9LTZ1_9BACT|nr:T9SS type A sorting domain-containing protein [Catalinimonas alkaloidigena]SDL65398.1 Por secretion system C-terminal sorting domain-containing protein [Catalinimonas alkaloidigena]
MKNRTIKFCKRLLLVLLVMGGAAQTSRAKSINSAAAGNWNTPATWSCNCVPEANDKVTVQHAITSTGNVVVKELAFGSAWWPVAGNGGLTVASGTFSVTSKNPILFGINGQMNRLTVANGAKFSTPAPLEWQQGAIMIIDGFLESGGLNVTGGRDGQLNVSETGVVKFTGDMLLGSGPHTYTVDGELTGQSLHMTGDSRFDVGPEGVVTLLEDVTVTNGTVNSLIEGAVYTGGNMSGIGGGNVYVARSGLVSVAGGLWGSWQGFVGGPGTFCLGCPLPQPLPVELVSFQGQASAAGAELSWQTASETDNAGFAVERSWDGQHYQQIGFVAGQGRSTALQTYRFTDTGFSGRAYYRLRQEDFEGSQTYHKSIHVIDEPSEQVQAYPNPFLNTLTLTNESTTPQQVNVYSLQGRLVGHYEAPQQHTGEWQLPLGHLPAGAYLLEVITLTDRQHVRVIKQ